MFTIRAASPSPISVTRQLRPGGASAIVQFQWHATRGATGMDRQVGATENWFSNPINGLDAQGDPKGWGSSADLVLGPDYRKGGQIVIVEFGDWLNTYSTWSAGYGERGQHTLPASRSGIAIEVAQPAGKDSLGRYTGSPTAAFESFDEATVEACVWLARHCNERIVDAGGEPIPAVRIPAWDQHQPIPRGHIGHEDLANGLKLGKHDPGFLFPWGRLLDGLAADGPAGPSIDMQGLALSLGDAHVAARIAMDRIDDARRLLRGE